MTKIAFPRFGFLALLICCWYFPARSQTPSEILTRLQSISTDLAQVDCNTGQGNLISNKAMNIFLSNKLSSYLSDQSDLSLYKNYVNINAAKGVIAITHNLHQPVDSDDYVRSFVTIGARANFANAYTARFSEAYTQNQLGFTIQKVLMGEPQMSFNRCGSQKQDMDANRALILQQLSSEISNQVEDLQKALAKITTADVPGQNLQTVKTTLTLNFYAAIRKEYQQKFAEAQSDLLINSNDYNVVSDNWTIFGIYVPVIGQKFEVISNLNHTQRHNYPVEVTATHTRFWEMPKTGRIFFSLSAGLSINNSVQGGQLTRSRLDGTYSGDYKNYLTPVSSGKVVYFPPNSHVGISFRLDKNYGIYRAANGILGIPIVLINNKGIPAINFEFQVTFNDMNHSLQNHLPENRTLVALTVGIPFSKIVY